MNSVVFAIYIKKKKKKKIRKKKNKFKEILLKHILSKGNARRNIKLWAILISTWLDCCEY